MLVGKKVPRKLVLVIDPQRVPNEMTVKNSNGRAAGTGLQSFMSNGVTKVLAPYFKGLEVVRPGDPRPEEPHLVADMELQGVSFQEKVVGNLRYKMLRMQWSLAIRASEMEEYVFSYAGEGISSGTWRTAEEGADQMLTDALNRFQSTLTEKKLLEPLYELDAEGEASEKLMKL